MSGFQKVIKYCAIAFAILLAVGIISGITSAVVTIVSGITGNSIFRDDREIVDFSENFSGVKSLDVDISTGHLLIKEGDTFRVEAENVHDDFSVRVSGNGTLILEENASRVHFLWFNFGGFGNPNSNIVLYLPEDFVAKDVEINTGAGRVTIEELQTESLVVSAGTGNIKGSNMTAEEVQIDGGVGTISFEEVSFEDTDFNCGVGSLNIKGELFGDNTIDCGVGEVKLELKGNVEDYELDIEAGIGPVRVNGDKIKDKYKNNRSAKHSIEVDGGVGSVKIDFVD